MTTAPLTRRRHRHVTDDVAGSDGTDRLTNIERLQFADQSVVLVPGLNNDPVGALTILDAAPTRRTTRRLRVSCCGCRSPA